MEVYRATLAEHGHDPASVNVNVLVPVFVTEDRDKARGGFEETFNNYLAVIRSNSSQATSRLANLSYDEVYDKYAAIGDPEQCIAKLRSLQEIYQLQEFMCWFNTGGMLPHGEVEKSMRLFAREVMPHFK